MITSQLMDQLGALESQIPAEDMSSLRATFTRRHWHPFGTQVLKTVSANEDVDFGPVLRSILDSLDQDLDPFVVSRLLGNFKISVLYIIYQISILYNHDSHNPYASFLTFIHPDFTQF